MEKSREAWCPLQRLVDTGDLHLFVRRVRKTPRRCGDQCLRCGFSPTPVPSQHVIPRDSGLVKPRQKTPQALLEGPTKCCACSPQGFLTCGDAYCRCYGCGDGWRWCRSLGTCITFGCVCRASVDTSLDPSMFQAIRLSIAYFLKFRSAHSPLSTASFRKAMSISVIPRRRTKQKE